MNIKITEDQAYFIFENSYYVRYLFGSYLYNNSTKESDTDCLIVYDSFHEKSDLIYPNYHQFQWDDKKEKFQYIFTSTRQFWKNLLSGDSTINADVILLYDNYSDSEKLNICRTYNIIKSFIGFAKRDIKNYKTNKGKNKLFHIERGLYCANKLLNNELPELNDFEFFGNIDIKILEENEKVLREVCNKMFEQNDLTMYPKNPIIKIDSELEKLLLDSKI